MLPLLVKTEVEQVGIPSALIWIINKLLSSIPNSTPLCLGWLGFSSVEHPIHVIIADWGIYPNIYSSITICNLVVFASDAKVDHVGAILLEEDIGREKSYRLITTLVWMPRMSMTSFHNPSNWCALSIPTWLSTLSGWGWEMLVILVSYHQNVFVCYAYILVLWWKGGFVLLKVAIVFFKTLWPHQHTLVDYRMSFWKVFP